MIYTIRKKIDREEFDYQTLLDCLKGYSRPRDKITDMINKGQIIRIKKGLYIFGEDFRKRPYSREILANLIYGPSYISLEYALSFHGIIPERSESLTSVTTGRSRTYSTPVGIFLYKMIPLLAFRAGMTRIELEESGSFLISSPEKALSDMVHLDRGTGIRTQKDLEGYIHNHLRIDPFFLREFDASMVLEIADRYRSLKIRILGNYIKRIQRKGGL